MSVARRIVALLADGPLDTVAIASRLEIDRRDASVYVARLRKAKLIYAIDWINAQRAIHAAGDLPDAPRPRPRTVAQMNRKQHRRIKADPVKRLARTMADKARRARQRRPPPQSWLSALPQ